MGSSLKNLEGVRKLTKKNGISHRPEWENGPKLLRDSAEKGQMEEAQFLMANGCNPDSKRRLKFQTKYQLRLAVKHGNLEIMKNLLEKGADVNVSNKDGNSPLHEAVKRKDVGATVLLVEYGANVNPRNNNGEMPLHVALEKGLILNAEYLLNHGAEVNSVCTNYFKEGYTPLHFAAENGYEGIVDLLLKKGAIINAIAQGITPLSLAAKMGHSSIVNSLLMHGGDVNICRTSGITKGKTPLHSAAEQGHASITKNLLKHGADVNCLCTANVQEGYSPLHFAVRKGHVSVARILLECGANVDAQGKSGDTILHVAVSVAKTSLVEMVLNYGPDVNNENNRSSLNLALNGSPLLYRNIVELLLQNGFNIRDEADVNAVSQYCKSSIHAAALNGYVTVLEALLEHGASANSKDKNGQTPLYAAAKKGNLQVIETLLKYGADIDSRDQCGRTALHIASWVGHASIVRGLLDYGSDVNITDSGNETALDFAKKAKYESIQKAHLYDSDDDLLCFQDDYVDNAFCLYDDVHEILENHIVKLKTFNIPVNGKYQKSTINSSQRLKVFTEKCMDELVMLRQTSVGSTKHSFFHFLTKSIHHLAIILGDDNVSSCVTSIPIKEMFPLYGSIIYGHLTMAKHRRKILKEVNACVFHIFPKLTWDCIQKIIPYLSNRDLMSVIHACKLKCAVL